MEQTIKNIIFDFGNVLLDLDIPRTEKAFLELIDPIQSINKTRKIIASLIEAFEVSTFSEVAFRKEINGLSKSDHEDHQIDTALNAMLLHFPDHRFKLLEKLKNQYNTYLLSNTNAIHLRWVKQYLAEVHAIEDYNERFFKKTYYSHLVRLRKPGKEIFEHVLSDANIKAQETLFIDDNISNIETANILGFHTILHDPKNDIGEILKKEGLF